MLPMPSLCPRGRLLFQRADTFVVFSIFQRKLLLVLAIGSLSLGQFDASLVASARCTCTVDVTAIRGLPLTVLFQYYVQRLA